MERADLLKVNGEIFIGRGQALNEFVQRDVKVWLSVTRKCNAYGRKTGNLPQIFQRKTLQQCYVLTTTVP